MLNVEQVAAVCHEANRTYCKTLGDSSQPAWRDAPKWQTDSAIDGVEFLLEEPMAIAKSCHERWLATKASEGWAHGSVKDPEAKAHPCMVPFEDLPPEQQAKDHLFHAIVRALAPHVARD